MDKLKEFFKNHQQAIVLIIGYLLVASLGFGLGRLSIKPIKVPEIKIEQASSPNTTNYTPNVAAAQTVKESSSSNAITNNSCKGKIKGSSSHTYHLPGGAFYDKTTSPIACFATEAEAKAAGFKKSSR